MKDSSWLYYQGRTYRGRVWFCAWPAESSRELMFLGCRHHADRSSLVPFHVLQTDQVGVFLGLELDQIWVLFAF